jgi:anaerobic selenocysteine-containing dehydrogenase
MSKDTDNLRDRQVQPVIMKSTKCHPDCDIIAGLAKRFHHGDHKERKESPLKNFVDSVCSVVRGFL